MAWPFPGLKKRKYRVILVDNPTEFIAGKKGRPQHYKRMRDQELAQLPILELAHPDGAWLLFWATAPRLYRNPPKRPTAKPSRILRPDEIAARWGFDYSSMFAVWIKLKKREGRKGKPLFYFRDSFHMGQGYTSRKNAEYLLLFRVGRPKRLSKAELDLIFASVREHSRKPEEQYDKIEAYAEGPYAELFARGARGRKNWDVWGDEVGKFRD